MWQSRVEIEHYSVVYFDHITTGSKSSNAELPLRAGLICTAKTHEYLLSLRSAYEPCPLWKFALQCFECGNAVKIHNGIMFDFYLRLPQIHNCIIMVHSNTAYKMRNIINITICGNDVLHNF